MLLENLNNWLILFFKETTKKQDAEISKTVKVIKATKTIESAECAEAAESVQSAEAIYIEGNTTVFIKNLTATICRIEKGN